jgi:murein DD-endopeptidase MepM/ murein hydrolase activator NlpD
VTVAPGQTLYAIAREHNVPVRALIDINNLDPPYALRAGQRIKVPMLPTHTVGEGETLTTLARRYGVGVRSLAETNHIEPPYRIVPGTRLLIPRAAVEESVASSPDHVLRVPPGMDGTASTAPANPNHVLSLPPDAGGGRAAPVHSPETEIATLTPPPLPPPSTRNLPSGRAFLWPIHGTIASPFGPKPGGAQNDGVNIVAKRGTSVHAAEDGVVVYAGNELRGYGNLLLIRHAGGWTTAYAHNDELLVRRGAHVKRGQVISKVGGTGGVSSPQLHFELRQSGRPVDPVAIMGPMS